MTATTVGLAATPLLLTPEEAARRLACGRTYIYGLIASGELESVKVGRLRRVPAVAAEEYVERLRTQRAASMIPARSTDVGASGGP